MSPKRALAALILLSSIVRLVAAINLGLGNDEAYHFLYAVHPDLSYYDHPPMLAWIEMAGLTLSGSLFSTLALRAGFIVLFAGSTWLMWRIASRWYGPWAGFYAALALNLTGYYGLAASTFALPDGPLLFFWLLTIDRLSSALEQPGRLLPWAWAGLAWGGAMLSKYHAIFLPAGTALYLVLHRPKRHWLTRPGPYLAIGLGLLVFSPVIVWNASHDWVSFVFQGGRAVGGLVPRPGSFATAVLAQAGYLFPWIWLPLILILVRQLRNWSRLETNQERLVLCLAVCPLGVFSTVACFRSVLPHWGLIGLASLFPLLGRDLFDKSIERPEKTRQWLTAGAVFSLFLLGSTMIEYRTGWLQQGGSTRWNLFTNLTDPTADLYGWDQVADRIERLGILDDPKTFLFTRMWYQSAQLAHALRMKRPVLCYNVDDPRGFAFWSEPENWVGHDGILVTVNDDFTPVEFFERWFKNAIPLADFWVERAGKPVRRVRAIRLVEQVAPFPFDFSPASLAAREMLRVGKHPLNQAPKTARQDGPDGTLPR
jgi:hypothetical protein